MLTGPVVLKSAANIYMSKEPLISSQMIGMIARLLPEPLKPRTGRTEIKLLPPREWFPLDWSDPVHQALRKEIRCGRLLTEE